MNSETAADERADVVIVGGGIAGLAAAAALQGSGLRPLLLEASHELGGRAVSWTDPHTGDRVDIGPHVMLNHYLNLLALLQELGTQDQVIWDRDQLTTLATPAPPFTFRLRRLPPPLHLLPAGLAVPQVSLRDKLSNWRLGWMIMALRETDLHALDTISGTELMQRMGVSRRFREWFWNTAAMTVLNAPLEQCSAGALMRFARQALGHSDIRLGFAAQGLADLFVPGCTRLIEQARGELRLGVAVQRIEPAADGGLVVHLRNGRPIRTRHCIAAVEPQALPALLPPQAGLTDPQSLARLRPSAYVSVYLWFGHKLTHKRSWGRTWAPENLYFDFYDLSNIRPGWQQRTSVITCNLMYAQRLPGWSDEQLVQAAVREIADYLPQAQHSPLLHWRVHRIPMAIPCCEPGTQRLRPATRTAVPGLYVAGDFVDTGVPLCMESAVRAARLAAEAVWSDIGRPRRLAHTLPEPRGFCALVRKLAPGSGLPRLPAP